MSLRQESCVRLAADDTGQELIHCCNELRLPYFWTWSTEQLPGFRYKKTSALMGFEHGHGHYYYSTAPGCRRAAVYFVSFCGKNAHHQRKQAE